MDDDSATRTAYSRTTRRDCAWCAASFAVAHRPGRPRLYCRHACRQRAYEHRHGFLHRRTIVALPGQDRFDRRPRVVAATSGLSGYERGGQGINGAIVHALCTSVRPEGHRRQTLCGLLSTPSGGMFATGHPRACRTCTSIADRRPLDRPVEASNELARLRALLEEASEERLGAAATLTWLRTERRTPWPSPSRSARPPQGIGFAV